MKPASSTVSLKLLLASSTELTRVFTNYKSLAEAIARPGISYLLSDDALVIDEDFRGDASVLLVCLEDVMTGMIVNIILGKHIRSGVWGVHLFGTTDTRR